MKDDIWSERRTDSPRRGNESRTEWARDYGRLIHSAAFRRLQAKTQVLGLGESDFYRTRLTHSMEVAQIGTGIVKHLEHREDIAQELKKILPDHDLMDAICLAHDIGHPPFGHGGEVALNYCMKEHGGFEGNAQTLRIISKLEKNSEKHGLNPTRRMMLGILKYPVNYSELAYLPPTPTENFQKNNWLFKSSEQKPPKCYFDEEQDVINFVFEPLSASDIKKFTQYKTFDNKHSKPNHKALDTSIMELADDISYSLHDLEDAISLKMITKAMWEEHFSEHLHLFDNIATYDADLTSEDVANSLFGASYQRKICIGNLIHLMITNISIEPTIPDADCPFIKYNAVLNQDINQLRMHIFELVRQKVILNENVQQLEFKGQKLVVELFEIFSSDPERFLPEHAKQKYKDATSRNSQQRVICDYIAGMTDDYATKLYEKIFTPRKGSIFDRL
jgi:dGTPase